MAKKRKGTTVNPKFRAGKSAPAYPLSESAVGGISDQDARRNVTAQGIMLHRQLAKNKSTGIKVPKGR